MSEDEKSQELILTKNGTPYASIQAAGNGMTQKGLSISEYEIVEHETNVRGEITTGFAIKRKINNNIPSVEISVSPPTDSAPPPTADTPPPTTDTPPPKKGKFSGYSWVRFSERGDLISPEDVELHLNGETLVYQRGKDGIAPEEYLEVADHTTYSTWKNDESGEPGRKIEIIKQTFPYTRLRPSTKEEFDSKRKQWTKESIEHVKQYGSRGIRSWL